MATHVQCPNCGSYNTSKTTNGKVSDVLAKTGAVVGGALLNMATGGVAAGLLGVVCTLFGTGYVAERLTYWQTELGRFGTALTQTWLWMPLFVSVFAIVLGAVILFYEYRRED